MFLLQAVYFGQNYLPLASSSRQSSVWFEPTNIIKISHEIIKENRTVKINKLLVNVQKA